MKIKALGQVLGSSLKSTFSGHLWKWLVGSASTLFGVLLAGKNFLNTSVETSFYIGLAIPGVLLNLRFGLFLCINIAKLLHYRYKESVYGNAIILLRDSWSNLTTVAAVAWHTRKHDDFCFIGRIPALIFNKLFVTVG